MDQKKKISGDCVCGTLTDEGESATLIYVDGTRGLVKYSNR